MAMAVKIVFLHGIGDGDPQADWLAGLNQGLAAAGHPPVDRAEVLAPQYSELLSTDGLSAKMPPVTYRGKGETQARFDFARRQAKIERMLGLSAAPTGFGAHMMPTAPLNTLQGIAVEHLTAQHLPQVKRYVQNEGLRGAILGRLLAQDYGDEIILIGHSLGSVIAIDLLDHLPATLKVRRFITIGSPASAPALHEGSERLLKKFPYSRVDDWSNIFNPADLVTGGRGLAWTFPAAQDFAVSIGTFEHGARAYLAHPAAASLVAQILYPGEELALASGGVAVRLTDEQLSIVLLLRYGHVVAEHIKDTEDKERYRGALRMRQDQVAAEYREMATVGETPLAPELYELIDGDLPDVPHRWELWDAVHELTVLALTSAVDPYEIEVGKAPMRAMPVMAQCMGFSADVGEKVVSAVTDVQTALNRKSGVPWGRVITAAAGVALLAAGPVGLMVAAPATAAGAAAMTGGLAAFGPGGMMGGLAMLGGLAGTGAALTTGAVTVGGAAAESDLDLQTLVLRIAVEHARKLLDLPFESSLWYSLCEAEARVSSEINRLEAFSEPKAEWLMTLREIRTAIGALMRFMIETGLAPQAILAGASPQSEESVDFKDKIRALRR